MRRIIKIPAIIKIIKKCILKAECPGILEFNLQHPNTQHCAADRKTTWYGEGSSGMARGRAWKDTPL